MKNEQLVKDLKTIQLLLKDPKTLIKGHCLAYDGEKVRFDDSRAVQFDFYGAIYRATAWNPGPSPSPFTERTRKVMEALRRATPRNMFTESEHFTHEVAMAVILLALVKAEHFPDPAWMDEKASLAYP